MTGRGVRMDVTVLNRFCVSRVKLYTSGLYRAAV